MSRRQTRLGDMLWLYRIDRDVSLRELAPQIGISYATLARIEAGRAFDVDTLMKVWTWLLATHEPKP